MKSCSSRAMPSRSSVTNRGGQPPVGEHERDEEPGEWRRRILPGQLVLGTMNGTAISPNTTNAAMPSMSTGSR